MSMSDPIADLCTQIRNATMRKHSTVSVPFSKIKKRVVEVLKTEGFIENFVVQTEGSFSRLLISLKYDRAGESIIRRIQRISKPGRRVHSKVVEINPVLSGQGIAIITTSKGVFSDRECRAQNVGGEILCHVW